jgi:type II secretory pathway component GspD/PulD (secretin)
VQKGKSGIPFLVDLPLVGSLFGYNTNTESRKDLIILVTPRIIDDGGTE